MTSTSTALLLLLLCTPPSESAPATAMTYTDMRCSLYSAGVPERLHEEFMDVAWCESDWKLDQEGDDGRAIGIYQIWPLWVDWAEAEGYGLLDRNDPLDATYMAYRIGERDFNANGNRWRQWTAQPGVGRCRAWRIVHENEIDHWYGMLALIDLGVPVPR